MLCNRISNFSGDELANDISKILGEHNVTQIKKSKILGDQNSQTNLLVVLGVSKRYRNS